MKMWSKNIYIAIAQEAGWAGMVVGFMVGALFGWGSVFVAEWWLR